MAFEEVNNSGGVNPGKDIEVGESLLGYVLGFRQGKHGTNIIMRNKETGEDYTLYSSGNIKYAVRDGRVKQGLLTRITRKPNEKIKGMDSSMFTIEQDPEDTVDTAGFNAVFDGDGSDRRESVKAATDNGIKAQAAKLVAGVANGRSRA